MDPVTLWGAAVVAILTVLTTCGLQIASFIRAGNSERRAEARAAEALDYARKTAELLNHVKTNTDGMATAAKEVAALAQLAATDARNLDRASTERMQTAGLAAAAGGTRPTEPAPASPQSAAAGAAAGAGGAVGAVIASGAATPETIERAAGEGAVAGARAGRQERERK